MTGYHKVVVLQSKKPKKRCDTVVCVVTQVIGAMYKVRLVSKMFTQMARDKSSHKLSSLNWFHFENLRCLLIIFRSGLEFGTIGGNA